MGNTLSVLLADDEPLARARLKSLLADLAPELKVNVAAEAGSGEEVLAALAGVHADVILLDIQMPGMNGLDIAQRLAALPQTPAVIFVTAFEGHALRAFDLRAVDYLLKPVRLERLREALSRISPRPPQGRTHFAAQEPGRVWHVPVEEVLYLRAELRYVTARTREREYLLDDSLIRLEEELSGSFLRIHRNCLVAHRHLLGFRRVSAEAEGHWEAVLKDWPETLPVSRRQIHVIREFRGG
ncbi:MAG: response regulator transcription factor [Betaproteobacteria bacterium]|nr:response regulator transcription factor [Betaproteobacteria bacterium]